MKAAIYIKSKGEQENNTVYTLECCKYLIEQNGFLIYHVYYDDELCNLIEDSKKGLFNYIICNESIDKLVDLSSKGINLIVC
jgi:hypothetical protein